MEKALKVLIISLVLCILVVSSALAKDATSFLLDKFKEKQVAELERIIYRFLFLNQVLFNT